MFTVFKCLLKGGPVQEGATQGHFIGIFQVVADGHPAGQGGNADWVLLEPPVDIEIGGIALHGGAEGQNHLLACLLLSLSASSESMVRSAGPMPSMGEIIPPSTW